MPVPKVGSLDQDKYMNKCMSWASDEHSEMDQDQKVAMCMTSWRDAKGISQSVKKTLITLYNTVKKQLASYQTTANGDNPHYHYYEIDSEGDGQTVSTIATDRVVIEIDPHEHKISKWVIGSAQKHTHGMDVVEKSAKHKSPAQSVFKTFEKYDKALKGYYKPMQGSSNRKPHITKSYLEKIMSKVLKTMVNKQGEI